MHYRNTSAAALYERIRTKRRSFELEAEQAAKLTIPSLFTVNGHVEGQRLIKPRNGIGARGVNHMSSRLLMAMLPARASFFRMITDGAADEILKTDEKGKAEVEEALAGMEREVQKSIATSGIRVPAVEAFRQLLVAGNVLTYTPDDSDSMQTWPLKQYVVDRDLADNLTLIVLLEEVSYESLSEELQMFTLMHPSNTIEFGAGLAHEGVVQIYTKVWLNEEDKYETLQEIGGATVPDSGGTFTKEELPYHALRWARVDGENYGRSLVSEYDGTLVDVEILTKALVEGAVAASRVIPLVNPNGALDPEDIDAAENGEAVFGKADDLTFAQLNKFADFKVAREELDEKRRELSAVFLLNVQRSAERVTAEEIRLFADELEASHAGAFTLMASEFQLPLIKRILRRLTKDGIIPGLPKALQGHIKPAVVTGVDALGRSEDLQKINAVFTALAPAIGAQTIQEYANPGTLLKFAIVSAGLDIPGAVKTDEEVEAARAAAQQQALLADMASKAAGPTAAGIAGNPEVAAEVMDQVQG